MKSVSIVSHRIATAIVVVTSMALAFLTVRILYDYALLSLIMVTIFVAMALDTIYSHLVLEKIIDDYEKLKSEMT